MSYNHVTIIGRLAANPERKVTNSGKPFCNLRVAVNRNYKDQNGETPCDFLDVVVWGNTCEFVTSCFNKGSWIGVDGSIETRSYIDKKGNKRRQTEIKADRCFFVGDKQQHERTVPDNSISDGMPIDFSADFDGVSIDCSAEPDDSGDLPF